VPRANGAGAEGVGVSVTDMAVETRGHGAKCAFTHPTLALLEVGESKGRLGRLSRFARVSE